MMKRNIDQGIEISLSSEEIENVFWDAAAPGSPTKGILEFLTFLKQIGIRTAVISNICGVLVYGILTVCTGTNMRFKDYD